MKSLQLSLQLALFFVFHWVCFSRYRSLVRTSSWASWCQLALASNSTWLVQSSFSQYQMCIWDATLLPKARSSPRLQNLTLQILSYKWNHEVRPGKIGNLLTQLNCLQDNWLPHTLPMRKIKIRWAIIDHHCEPVQAHSIQIIFSFSLTSQQAEHLLTLSQII